MENSNRKIIFIDDAAEQMPTLIKILKEGFDEFKIQYNKPNLILPEIGEILIRDWIHPEAVDENYNKYIVPQKPLINYYIIDICLTNKESNFSAVDLKLTETSGYKLAEKIKDSAGFSGRISIISRILSAAKGSNIDNNKFGTIIKKPLDANGNPKTIQSLGNQYINDLPRELYTHDMKQAFCNLIFYTYFKFVEETK